MAPSHDNPFRRLTLDAKPGKTDELHPINSMRLPLSTEKTGRIVFGGACASVWVCVEFFMFSIGTHSLGVCVCVLHVATPIEKVPRT